ATALEVATIHDAAGLRERELDDRPPFRAPHHTITQAALVGGGGLRPIVGEVTLAHRGVLFLDELPEYRPSALDALRQPLEDGEVRIRRSGWIARYPCDTQVIAAMNLCRCGRTGVVGGRKCTCTAASKAAYADRLSGAIVDRFDIRTRMRLTGSIMDERATMSSAEAAVVVASARARQAERWGAGRLNGSMSMVRDPRFQLRPVATQKVERIAMGPAGGGRAQRSVIRVARTIADIADRDHVELDDVLQAWDLCRTTLGAADD
ncbi:MAG: / ComM-related protein, partial [Thermoleophilia bacterium]|nr:/ ComM-related protein [Thermoleophilia bacterium]